MSSHVLYNYLFLKTCQPIDMKTYVTGSVDRTCKLWDVRAEKEKQTFFGHEADVNSVCVSYNNKQLNKQTPPHNSLL